MKIIIALKGDENVSSFETLGENFGKELTEAEAISEISYLTASADQFGLENVTYKMVNV